MIGHGRPTLSGLLLAVVFALGVSALADRAAPIASAQVDDTATQNPPTMRLRISWGGNTPGAVRQWRGTISTSKGTITSPIPLGIEADEPGSMTIQENRLHIDQRSPRMYDGVDISITAPLDATLTVDLNAAEAGDQTTSRIDVGLAELVSGFHNAALDDRGNRLLICRAPGDMLRVRMEHSSLVFSPGDRLQLQVDPHLLPVSDKSPLNVIAELVPARTTQSIWSQEFKTFAGASPESDPVLIDVEVPQTEGVYDLVLKAVDRSRLRWNRAWSKPLAERRVQFIVLSRQAPAELGAAEWSEVGVIDAANPKWWDRLKISRIPGLQLGPLGSGNSLSWNHPLGQVMQLGPGGRGADISWEAYSLPVSKPGLPHIVEVEYPSDVPQTLGISIVEPNAAGAVTPLGLDSGFYTSDEAVAGEPVWQKHRLLFWPRTKAPLVLLTNRRDGSMATYGKIRLLVGPKHLPRLLPRTGSADHRLLAAYLNRPLFPENFSASEALDRRSGASLDDWQTFYEGGSRLVEYLNSTGQNGLMLTVAADGSTIYPTSVLEPNPRYDTGAYSESAQDPLRKDIVEMLFRLFDREGLKLIPALQFSSTLPQLEAALASDTGRRTGIVLIGPSGQPWSAEHATDRGAGAYYNPLNPTVQDAMLAVVREISQNYGRHPSFAGIGIDLSASGYAQLPSEQWPLDDDTVRRFVLETRADVPLQGANRFAKRAEIFAAPGPIRDQWLKWRAEMLADLHRRMAAEMRAAKPEAKLYLAGAEMFDDSSIEQDLRPSLPAGRTRMEEVLSRIGIGLDMYAADSSIVLMRPNILQPPASLAAEGIDLQINSATELDRQLMELPTSASLLVHQHQPARLESFEAKSPFGVDKTHMSLLSQLSPSGSANRRRFVHSMATLDATAIFDGGRLLALGQEETMRGFAAAYRRLPALRFKDVAGVSQPIAIRTLVSGQHTYVYFVNDSSWPVTVSTDVDLPLGSTMNELSGMRTLKPPQTSKWSVSLEPYDFLAVRFTTSAAVLSRPSVQWRDDLSGYLTRQVRDLGARVASLANPTPMAAPVNANFDQAATRADASRALITSGATVAEIDIPGWLASAPQGTSVELDQESPASGSRSVRIYSTGPPVSLRSETIEPPTTGRLELLVWLKISDTSKQPPLRLALAGMLDGAPYYKFGEIKPPVAAVSEEWKPYVFRIEDLPPEGLRDLCVRFDMMGAGEVWIDNVQLYDLKFLHDKHRELLKIVAAADSHLTADNLGDCLRVMESYWPRFLQANVPLTQLPVAEPVARTSKPEPEAEKAAQSPGVLNRIKSIFRR